MANNVKIVKRITMREICGLGRNATEQTKAYFLNCAKNGGTELAVIAGEVSGYGSKTTQFGESYYLVGLFFAQNRQTGDMLKASQIYLPKDITEQLIAKKKALTDDVRFGVTISVVEDSSAMGYTYITEPIRDAQVVNKEAEIMQNFLALPAPKNQAKLASKK